MAYVDEFLGLAMKSLVIKTKCGLRLDILPNSDSKLSINKSNSSAVFARRPVQWYYRPFLIVDSYLQNKAFF